MQGKGSVGLGRGAAQFAPPVRVGPSGAPGAMCPQARVAPPGCLMLDGGWMGHREGGGVIWAGPGPCPPWWGFAAKPWGWGDSEHARGWGGNDSGVPHLPLTPKFTFIPPSPPPGVAPTDGPRLLPSRGCVFPGAPCPRGRGMRGTRPRAPCLLLPGHPPAKNSPGLAGPPPAQRGRRVWEPPQPPSHSG